MPTLLDLADHLALASITGGLLIYLAGGVVFGVGWGRRPRN